MGLNVVTSPPMVFSVFRIRISKPLGKLIGADRAKWIMKPLLTCPVCMSSVWGTVVWFSCGQGITWLWPVFLIKLAGLIYIVMMLCYKDPVND